MDDGSVEPPRAVVARFANALDVRLIEQRNSGPAAARNAGRSRWRAATISPSPTTTVVPIRRWLRRARRGGGAAPGMRHRWPRGELRRRWPLLDREPAPHRFPLRVLQRRRWRRPLLHHVQSRYFPRRPFAPSADSTRRFPSQPRRIATSAIAGARRGTRWCMRTTPSCTTRTRSASARSAGSTSTTVVARTTCIAHDRGAVRRLCASSRCSFYTRLVGHPLSKGVGSRAAALSALLFTSQVAYVCGYLPGADARVAAAASPVFAVLVIRSIFDSPGHFPMRRRQFVQALGAVLAAPVVARAMPQTLAAPKKLKRIGIQLYSLRGPAQKRSRPDPRRHRGHRLQGRRDADVDEELRRDAAAGARDARQARTSRAVHAHGHRRAEEHEPGDGRSDDHRPQVSLPGRHAG